MKFKELLNPMTENKGGNKFWFYATAIGLILAFVLNSLDTVINTRKSDYSELYQRLQEDNTRLRFNDDVKTEQINVLNQDLALLKAQIANIQAAQFDIPFPTWMKDLEGRVISINDAYEMTFLIPLGFEKKDYLNKTDSEFYGESKGKKLTLLHRKAISSGLPYNAINMLEVGEESETYRVIQWVVTVGTLPVGVSGIAIPTK